MYHYVLRALPELWLFDDVEEALHLFALVARAVPGAEAICVMGNHVHILARRPIASALRALMSGYARYYNARRGRRGALWRPLDPPSVRDGAGKARLDARYVVLNASRARLVRCPLEWPLSSHRDALGLVARPIRRRVSDPEAHHRFVSDDSWVVVGGTELPQRRERPGLEAIAGAASEVFRMPLTEVRSRGPCRQVFVQAALALGAANTRAIADRAGITVRQVRRVPDPANDLLALIERVAGDPRFPGIVDRDPRLFARRG